MVNVKLHINRPTNDFDVLTVNDGMDEINKMIDQLENYTPEELYENEEFDIEQMMKVNKGLRDKIKDIGELVISAITKASLLKKKIVTHRDEPADKDLKDKNKQIRDQYAKLSSYERRVKVLNIKLASLTDNESIAHNKDILKVLNKEIKELKSQQIVLSKQLKTLQQTMNKLYDDPDFRDKMSQTQNDIKTLKGQYREKDKEHKSISSKQEKILQELTSLNSSKHKLQERKIYIEKGIKDKGLPPKLAQIKEEVNTLMRKNQLMEKLHDKSKAKLKIKMHDKERRIEEIHNEIQNIQDLLRHKIQENENLSKEVKNLKYMLPKVDRKMTSKHSTNLLDKIELNDVSQSIDNPSYVLGNVDESRDSKDSKERNIETKDKDLDTQEENSRDDNIDDVEVSVKQEKIAEIEFVDKDAGSDD